MAQPNRSCLEATRIVQDYFIFTLIAFTGLRVSEALTLNVDDIGDDYLIIRKDVSKNRKEGTVYFGKKTKTLIDDYLTFREFKFSWMNNNYLFPSKGKRGYQSRSYLHKRFKYWLDICGLPSHLSIHSLRHTYGTLCLDKGLSLTFVRDNLRHSSISITSRYLHLTKENRKKVQEIF